MDRQGGGRLCAGPGRVDQGLPRVGRGGRGPAPRPSVGGAGLGIGAPPLLRRLRARSFAEPSSSESAAPLRRGAAGGRRVSLGSRARRRRRPAPTPAPLPCAGSGRRVDSEASGWRRAGGGGRAEAGGWRRGVTARPPWMLQAGAWRGPRVWSWGSCLSQCGGQIGISFPVSGNLEGGSAASRGAAAGRRRWRDRRAGAGTQSHSPRCRAAQKRPP
jgi:hypothetical protein